LSDSTDLAAAEIAAETVLTQLQEVITGRAPFPAWPAGGLPIEQSLPLIETAVATGQALQMSYYSPGRDELTHRLVEPYRLEHHGDTPYLIGFCHRAQAERVFRLDRIQAIALVRSEG
jgi:proteasome accessory factor C